MIHGIKLKCNHYTDDDFDAAFALCKESVSDSTGVGRQEFQDVQYLRNYLSIAKVAATLYDQSNGKLVLFMMVYDTPSSRSYVPLCGSLYVFMDKDYRGKSIVKDLVGHFIDQLVVNLGYPSYVTRGAFTAVSTFIHIKTGSIFTATIPKSINISKIGWMPSLVAYRDFRKMMTRHQWKCVSIPPVMFCTFPP